MKHSITSAFYYGQKEVIFWRQLELQSKYKIALVNR